ncbi:MAG: FAD-dependent oxidoreductase, partial [Ilumatobacteraceae bacterium]
PGLSAIGSISVLTIPSDNNTWSTTLYSASSDAPMRRLRDPDVFCRVVRECPLHAHWVDGEPISDVASMSGAVDRTRRFVLDGVPVATGMLSIADAAACTNPSVGRGMSFGLMHTVVMRDTVRDHLDDPAALSLAFHEATERQLDPWHEATRGFDRSSRGLMQAAIEGREPEPDPFAAVGAALVAACHVDEQAVRWFGEIQGCLALPMEIFARDGALAHVMRVAAGVDAAPIPGPDRQRLLELVS